MGRIYTGLAAWNLLFLTAAFVLGFFREAVGPETHILAGLFAAIFCCLVHAIVFAHFIGSGKWIKRGVDAAGMDPAIIKRTKRFKGKTFPFALFSMLFAVATAVLGGAALKGAAAPAVHFGFAIAVLALNVFATILERSAIIENAELIDRVGKANQARVAAGIQQTLLPAAAMEAMRAGSKVFFFLAANLWLLYAYRRWAMRHHDEPIVPYLVAFGLMVFIGLRLRAAERAADRV